MKQSDLFSGDNLKANGMARVLSHNRSWHELVHSAILHLANTYAYFTAEDLRNYCQEHDIPDPNHYNAWGAAISKASKAGFIQHAGFTKNHRSSAHGRVIGKWKKAQICFSR